MKRAHHPEQKEARRQALLAQAEVLLQSQAFATFRMADLAEQAGVAKGTLYLYFPTKESLFLALLQGRLGAWFRRTAEGLASLPEEAGTAEVARAFVVAVAADPGLVELISLLHGVLEQNVTVEEVTTFKRLMLTEMQQLAPVVEACLRGIGPGQGAQVFTRFYALVIGVHALEPHAPAVVEALRQPDLALFDLPFLPTLEDLFIDVLAGMTRR